MALLNLAPSLPNLSPSTLALALALTLPCASPPQVALAPTPHATSHPGQERDLEWTNYTPEQLAAKNKEKTLLSDIFHRKPAHELFCEEAVLRPSEGAP
jgi:hypothetical protein